MTTLARILVVILLPVFLILTNVRLIMTESFVRYEYGKTDFPPAPTLDPAERFPLALTGIDLITGRMSAEQYAALKLRNGQPAYQAREVSHMVDVAQVTQAAFTVHLIVGAVLVAALVALRGRRAWRALQLGSLATVALLLLIGVFAALSFNQFFTLFHTLFFVGNSWIFNYTDTLIQLYPLPLWFDASLIIVGATIGQALLIAALAAWALRSGQTRRSAYRVRTS